MTTARNLPESLRAIDKGLYLRGRIWWVYFQRNGRCVRQSTRTDDLGVARTVHKALRAEVALECVDAWKAYRRASEADLLAYVLRYRGAANRRDRKRGRTAAGLCASDVRAMLERSNGLCEITAIPFSLEVAAGTNRRPFAPSIDRIDISKGYSPENCRLICLSLNVAINIWGERLFRRIAEAFVKGNDRRCRARRRATQAVPS